MAKNRFHKGDFSKLSTGEIPVFTGLVEFVNRSGPVPALMQTLHIRCGG